MVGASVTTSESLNFNMCSSSDSSVILKRTSPTPTAGRAAVFVCGGNCNEVKGPVSLSDKPMTLVFVTSMHSSQRPQLFEVAG